MASRCVLLTAVCLLCLGCQIRSLSNRQDAASSADDPSTVVVQAKSAADTSVVYAYYFHRTFRCISCQTMEDLAARTIEERFAQQTQDGQVVWISVNVDEPEGKALGQQFNARGSELVVARMENGVCKDSKRLDDLWGLKDRPEAFSQYLVDEINARLSPVQGK
jgi:hypothetical protein